MTKKFENFFLGLLITLTSSGFIFILTAYANSSNQSDIDALYNSSYLKSKHYDTVQGKLNGTNYMDNAL